MTNPVAPLPWKDVLRNYGAARAQAAPLLAARRLDEVVGDLFDNLNRRQPHLAEAAAREIATQFGPLALSRSLVRSIRERASRGDAAWQFLTDRSLFREIEPWKFTSPSMLERYPGLCQALETDTSFCCQATMARCFTRGGQAQLQRALERAMAACEPQDDQSLVVEAVTVILQQKLRRLPEAEPVPTLTDEVEPRCQTPTNSPG